MLHLKTVIHNTFVDDEEYKTNKEVDGRESQKGEAKERKLFPKRYGIGWGILRCLLTLLFYFSHLMVAIVFITFFASAIAFNITIAMDMVSEMIAPEAPTKPKKDLLSVCLFVLLFALLLVSCFILSLFGEVLKIVLLKTTLQYNTARTFFVLVAFIVGAVWAGIERAESNRVSFAEYLEYLSLVCWIYAFVLSLLGSILLLMFVFKSAAKHRKAVLFVHVVIVLVLVAFAVISPIAFGIVANEASAGKISFVLFLPLFTAVLVIYTYFRGKKEDSKAIIFNKNISLLFLALFIFTIILSLFTNTPATCKSTCKDEARKNAEKVDRTTFSSNRYPVCSKTWTSIKLNIADLAFLANLTYNRAVEEGNSSAVQALANDFFKEQKFFWTVDVKSSRYFHLKYKNIQVVGIKGPATNTEFAETARLWDEIAALHSIGMIIPILSYFPDRFIAEYVSKTSFINTIFRSGPNTNLLEEVENRLKSINKTNDEVVLVGHSFGGGIAKIIGARLQIPAVSFSSPGIAYGYLKFGFSLKNASEFVVSISPQKDFVSLIDKHTGMQQMINCDGKTFVQCHLIQRTYCELHNGCGLGRSGCQAIMDN